MPKRNPEAEKQIADNAGMILSAIAGLSRSRKDHGMRNVIDTTATIVLAGLFVLCLSGLIGIVCFTLLAALNTLVSGPITVYEGIGISATAGLLLGSIVAVSTLTDSRPDGR